MKLYCYNDINIILKRRKYMDLFDERTDKRTKNKVDDERKTLSKEEIIKRTEKTENELRNELSEKVNKMPDKSYFYYYIDEKDFDKMIEAIRDGRTLKNAMNAAVFSAVESAHTDFGYTAGAGYYNTYVTIGDLDFLDLKKKI